MGSWLGSVRREQVKGREAVKGGRRLGSSVAWRGAAVERSLEYQNTGMRAFLSSSLISTVDLFLNKMKKDFWSLRILLDEFF